MCEIINHNYGSKIGYFKEEYKQESLMYNRQDFKTSTSIMNSMHF